MKTWLRLILIFFIMTPTLMAAQSKKISPRTNYDIATVEKDIAQLEKDAKALKKENVDLKKNKTNSRQTPNNLRTQQLKADKLNKEAKRISDRLETLFSGSDQKKNQYQQRLSSVMRTMKEMRSMGAASGSGL